MAHSTVCQSRLSRRSGSPGLPIANASATEAVVKRSTELNVGSLTPISSGLIKQRVAREGQGRSGGYRMLVAYRAEGRAVFLYGFAKNEQDNIEPDELVSLRDIATAWLNADAERIRGAIEARELQEVEHGEAGN